MISAIEPRENSVFMIVKFKFGVGERFRYLIEFFVVALRIRNQYFWLTFSGYTLEVMSRS